MTTQTVREYTGAIKDTVSSFWHGMSITLSHLFRRPMTVQYPDRTPMHVRDMLPPRYRGFLEVDTAICTGCQACERACPIGCIQITLEKDAANPKQRVVTQFDIDEAKCMFCGLCVEPCPTGSIQHTREFEASTRNIRNLVFRWADPAEPVPGLQGGQDRGVLPAGGARVARPREARDPRLEREGPDVPAARAPEAAGGEGREAAARREARGRRLRGRPGSCRRAGRCRPRRCRRAGRRARCGEAPAPRVQVRPRR